MAQTDLECANGALQKIGASRISALAGTDHVSVTMNERLPICKKSLLRMHPWNFAVKRTHIYPYPNFAISNATLISAELVELTHATAASPNAFAIGDWVTVEGIAGAHEANGTWAVATVPDTTHVRITAKNVTALTTYIASDLDKVRKSPAYHYTYLYTLPTDCLKVLRINERVWAPDWKIEAGKIASSDDELDLRYVYDVTDYAAMDTVFYELLQTYLAHDVCYRITQSSTLKNQMAEELQKLMAKARFDDAVEDATETVHADDWIMARGVSGSAGFEVGRF